jgi:uncharacterized membrane protein
VLRAWTALLLVLFLAAAVFALVERWRPSEGAGASMDEQPSWPVGSTFALLCIAVGVLLPLGAEFLFVRDIFNTRMNTVFKLFYQAWTLLAVGGGFAVFAVWQSLPRQAVALWSGLATVVLLASLVYPTSVVVDRTRGEPTDGLTLDGLAHWARGTEDADDLAAARWLVENLDGAPVVLEATGGGYQRFGRLAMATGYPTVLGWDLHEWQWRGTREHVDPRIPDVERVYKTTDEAEFRRLLDAYDVRYVVVGALERQTYGLAAADVERLDRWLTPVFEQGQLRIYENRRG